MPQVYNTISGGTIQSLETLPDTCPYCHKAVTPVTLFGFTTEDSACSAKMEVFMRCPSNNCNRGFIAYYGYDGRHFEFAGYTSQGTLAIRKFNETINSVSPPFVTIYNQASTAEQQNLLEICGVGFRKALEFLIKDYIIKNRPSEEEEIKTKMLGKCIDQYIDDTRIKLVAKRAAWLGNDETHYVKRWESKSLEDLKKLIELTVHWIEMELLTQSFEEDMPE